MLCEYRTFLFVGILTALSSPAWSQVQSFTANLITSGSTQTIQTSFLYAPTSSGPYQSFYAQQILINDTFSSVNACYIGIDGSGLKLLNDQGTVWLPSSLSNSQCTISSLSGSMHNGQYTDTLTVTFKPSFSGSKHMWADAYTQPGVHTPWIDSGSVYLLPELTLTNFYPSTGSGFRQVFQTTYSSLANGLGAVQVLFNGAFSSVQACYVGYMADSNTFSLLDDAGHAWLPATLPPGSSENIQNSQCTLHGSGSWVNTTSSGATVFFDIEFSPNFPGVKTIWTDAYNQAKNSHTSWSSDLNGTHLRWGINSSVPIVPTLLTVSPPGLTVAFADPLGAEDIGTIQVLVGDTFNSKQACYLGYDQPSKAFLLLNDQGKSWLPSSNNSLLTEGLSSNSQCELKISTAAVSGNELIVQFNVDFAPTFTGTKTVWANAYSVSSGLHSDWTSVVNGQPITYTASPFSTDGAPYLKSFSPNSGQGGRVLFNTTYSTGVNVVVLLFNDRPSSIAACEVEYDHGVLRISNDAGDAWLPTTLTPSSAGAISNSQCTLHGNSNTDFYSYFNFSVEFKPSFAGKKGVWTMAQSNSSVSATGIVNSPWYSSLAGAPLTWEVTADAEVRPTVYWLVPGYTHAEYDDPLGAADIKSTQVLVNDTFSFAHACFYGYDAASNSFLLLNDDGNVWLPTRVAPGSSQSVSNSQCTLSGQGSSVTLSENRLVLNYGITFQPNYTKTSKGWTDAYSTSSGLPSTWVGVNRDGTSLLEVGSVP